MRNRHKKLTSKKVNNNWSSLSLDNLEGKQFSRDVVRGVTQEMARDAHERILICRISMPKDCIPGITLGPFHTYLSTRWWTKLFVHLIV